MWLAHVGPTRWTQHMHLQHAMHSSQIGSEARHTLKDNAITVNVHFPSSERACHRDALSTLCSSEWHTSRSCILIHLASNPSSVDFILSFNSSLIFSAVIRKHNWSSVYFSKCYSMVMEQFSNIQKETTFFKGYTRHSFWKKIWRLSKLLEDKLGHLKSNCLWYTLFL